MQNYNVQSTADLRRLGSMKVFGILFLIMVAAVLGMSFMSIKPPGEFVAYQQLESILKAGKTDQIKRVIVTKGDPTIRLKIVGTEGLSSVNVPETARESLISELSNAGVPLDIREQTKSNLRSVLDLVLLAIVLIGGVVLVFRSIRILILKAQ